MNKLTVVTPRIINHSVTSLRVKRIKVAESSAASSKFQREGRSLLLASGISLAIWMVIAWVMMGGL